MGRARVATLAGLVVVGLLGLGVATAIAADSPDPDGADEADAMRPLILCTAPWPPFVETVPPPRPPSARPDPRALGFTPPMTPADAEGAGDADGAVEEGTGDDAPARPVPPAPLPPATGAPTEIQVAAADVPESAGDSDDAVAPPVPPVTKSLGRILAARETAAPPRAETEDATPASIGGGEPATAASDAARAETAARVAALPADPDVGVMDTAPASRPAPPPLPARETEAETETDSADPLERLRMPRARALLPQGRPGGPVTEAVVAACKAAGLPCRISLLPWLRPAEVLASGRCDGVFPVEPTPRTGAFMMASRPVASTRLAFFTLDTRIASVDDFTDFIVLARGPSDQAHHAHRAVEGLKETRLVFGPNLTRLVARLGTLRPDDRVALFGNYHVITRAMAAVGGSIPALSVVPAGTQSLHVGFARDRVPETVVRAFDQGLRRIAETRELQEILDLGGLEPVN